MVDVEEAAFAALPEDVEVRYSTVPTRIEQDADGVDVTLANGDSEVTERFDLVVGADGLRSTVRSLVFGPHEKFLRRLNYMAVAYQLPGPLSELHPNDGAVLAEPNRSLWIFPFADRAPTVLLNYHTDDVTRVLAAWERRLRSDIDFFQQNGVQQRMFFVPATMFQVAVRRVMAVGMRMPGTSHLLRGLRARSAADRLKEKDIARP